MNNYTAWVTNRHKVKQLMCFTDPLCSLRQDLKGFREVLQAPRYHKNPIFMQKTRLPVIRVLGNSAVLLPLTAVKRALSGDGYLVVRAAQRGLLEKRRAYL